MENAEGWLKVFPALDNECRFNMLIFLSNTGSKSFSEIKSDFHLSSASAMHHLDTLLKAELISNSYRTPSSEAREYSFYEITERGKKILEALLGKQQEQSTERRFEKLE